MCPSCRALYRLAESNEGKTVKCQKCGERFLSTPVAGADQGTAGISSSAPRPVVPPSARRDDDEHAEERPRRRRSRADEDDDRPRRRRGDDEDDDDRPRRQRDDDEDDDDRPRRRRKRKPSGSNAGLIIGIVVGVMILMCGGGVMAVVWSIKTAVKNVGDKVAVAVEKEQQRMQQENKFFDPNLVVDVQGPGVEVKFAADGTYRHDNHLANNDPQLANKYYKLYVVPLEKGKTYQIDMASPQFDSFLRLLSPEGKVLAQDDDGAGAGFDARIIFQPVATGKHKIVATSFNFAGEPGTQGPFTLTIAPAAGPPPAQPPPMQVNPRVGNPANQRVVLIGQATQVALGADGSFSHAGVLNATKDPVAVFPGVFGAKRYKQYALTMEPGKTYQIDAVSKEFDSMLYLVAPNLAVVALDDDGGGFPNARIRYTPQQPGLYKIAVTSVGPQGGNFTLTVRRE
jgi:predicted Zn finger-like uncharacterized protein